ncbi:uncharacterized protein LOC141605163 [Silene latifolia]|uniref:uncharacterized protein LOC141605163 n=1 Tax=Silene latifolia TaxID=37657 RepID=UPI003D778201
MDPSVAQAAAFAAQFHQPPPPPYQQPQQSPYSAELYPTPVANSTPSHPSYAEMITAAISWENSQGKESGSSKRAIAKYIDRVYTNLPPTHSALLTHHLKRLKTAGQLVMVKNSYQLPSVATNLPRSVEPQQPYESQPPYAAPSVVDQSDTGTVTPKRKPGRPPKLKTPVSEPVFVPEPVSVLGPGLDQVVENGSSLGKRRRGRPAKERNPAVEVVVPFVAPVADVAVVSNGQVGKRRGRPAKVKAVVNGGVAAAARVGRGRGRPKGVGNLGMKVGGSNVMAVVAVEKKRGWPKGKKRGKRVVNGSVAKGVGAGVGVVKRRGRKPKGFGLGVGVGVGVGMGGVMKRRGRKPKGVGVVSVGKVEKKVYNGKRRGRPKKTAIVKRTDGQGQETANEDLLKKLEDMQLKIRGAVDVLKPVVASQSEPNAITALQQLEELSAMDITASTALIESPLMTTVPIDMVAPPESTSEPEPLAPPSAPSMAFDEAPEMSMPSPFSMSGPGIENQQPMSWIQS